MVQLTRKRIKKIYVPYTLEETILGNVECFKYFGATISDDLRRDETYALVHKI